MKQRAVAVFAALAAYSGNGVAGGESNAVRNRISLHSSMEGMSSEHAGRPQLAQLHAINMMNDDKSAMVQDARSRWAKLVDEADGNQEIVDATLESAKVAEQKQEPERAAALKNRASSLLARLQAVDALGPKGVGTAGLRGAGTSLAADAALAGGASAFGASKPSAAAFVAPRLYARASAARELVQALLCLQTQPKIHLQLP